MPKVIAPVKSRVFYGWMALTGAVLVSFVAGGAFSNSFGAFLPVMCNEFGWRRGAVVTGFSVGMLTFGLPSPLIGILVDKLGPRVNIVLGNLLGVLGLIGMFFVREVWHIFLLFSLVGLGTGFGGLVPCATIVNSWFRKKVSLAMGIFYAGLASSGFVFPPMVTFLISSVGWRMAWLVLAGLVLVCSVLLGGLILVRNRPEDMNQVPDGIASEPSRGTAPLSGIAPEQQKWETKQALREPVIWLIMIFTAINFLALTTVIAHQIAYMQDLGFSLMLGAMTLSLFSIMSVVGRMGFGVLALKLNMRYLAIAGFLVQIIALLILLTTKSLAMIYVYAVLFGLGNGLVTVATPTLASSYFGREHYARILGLIYPLQFIAATVGPSVAGIIYDSAGTYVPAFTMIVILSLVGLVCAFFARRPILSEKRT